MSLQVMMKSFSIALLSGLLTGLQGCAIGPNVNPADPLEPLNRTVFQFNDGVDRAILKPVATAYRDVTPSPVRTGVSNFFGNISDVWSLVNNVLQLKPKESAEMLMRVSFNTIFGFAGVIDIASEMRLEKHSEDFGQTLGYWGVGSGPYVVLPLLGPSSARDTVGKLVDFQGDLVTQTDQVAVRNSLSALRLVDARASFLSAGDVLERAALDQYTFTRDAYLQRHRSLINPARVDKEERFDLPESADSATPVPSAPGK